LIIQDPRVNEEQNQTFLSMMEAYFGQSSELKFEDARPEYAYQVSESCEFVGIVHGTTYIPSI
jgi:hypothetical protein